MTARRPSHLRRAADPYHAGYTLPDLWPPEGWRAVTRPA
jgi:hypothetical protein